MSMSNYAIQVDDSLSKDLTQAELKVIQQVGFGLSNKEIAQKLIYLKELCVIMLALFCQN